MYTSILGTLVTVGAIAGLTGCENDSSAASNTAEPEQHVAVSAGPRLEFASLMHDFGTMSETETRSADVKFSNTGGDTLVIHDVKTTCGCTAAQPSKYRLAPGESAELTVTFEPTGPNEPGKPQRKEVRIFSNAENTPAPGQPIKTVIMADVQPFLIFEPRMVQFGNVELGKGKNLLLRVQSSDDQFKLLDVRVDHPDVTTRVLKGNEKPGPGDPMYSEKRSEYVELAIDPNTRWGGLYFKVDVDAEGRPDLESPEKIKHTSSLRAAAKIFGELAVTSRLDSFRFGVDPGGSFDRTVTIQRTTGQPFTVLSAQVTNDANLPQVAASTEQIADNEWAIHLKGVASTVAGYRHMNGKVLVTTDVPGEERIELSIFGVVRQPTPGT